MAEEVGDTPDFLSATIERSAQDLLDHESPDKVRGSLQTVIDSEFSSLQRRDPQLAALEKRRAENQAPYAAIAHLVGTKAVYLATPFLEHELAVPYVSERASSYQGVCRAFVNRTSGLYEKATELVLAELQNETTTYPGLWQYLTYTNDGLNAAKQCAKEYEKKLGRGLGPVTVPVKAGYTDNALLSFALLVTHAVRIYSQERGLPLPEKLAAQAKESIDGWTRIASTHSKLSKRIILGDKIASEFSKQGSLPPELTDWSLGLSNYTKDPQASDAFSNCPTESYLLERAPDQLHPSIKVGPWEKRRRCGGQFELLSADDLDNILAERFFEALGLEAPDGAFSPVRLQLAIGAEVAQHTIYADELCRRGLMAAARFVYEIRSSGQEPK